MEWGIKPGSSQEVENPGEECWDDKPQCLVLQKSKLDHEQIQMDGKKKPLPSWDTDFMFS